MQKFIARFSGMLVLFAFVFTACEEDDPLIDPNPIDEPPMINLSSEAGFIDGDETVDPGAEFSVKVEAEAGTGDLNALEITKDGDQLSIDSFTVFDAITQSDVSSNNPLALAQLTSDNRIELEIAITAPIEDGVYEYTFTVQDEMQLSESTTIAITVENPLTPLSDTLIGVLFNQAGDAGFGALDLDEGLTTGVTTSSPEASPEDAEIRDMGLDCTIPAPGLNWRRQIGTMNGADMRAVDLTQVENFSFENVGAVEEIVGAYESGLELEDGESINCVNANATAVTDVSEVLTEGDMFVVLRDGRYYLIRIDEINETDTNNEDNYVISIKY